MNRVNRPESGALEFLTKPTNLAGAAVLAFTSLYGNQARAWTDGGDVDSAYGTTINTETIYGFAGSPDGTSLKTVSDGSSGYETRLSTDGFASYDEVNSLLEAYDSSIVGDRIVVIGYGQSNDEVMLWNVDGGYYFTVTGLSSGSITGWTELEGSPGYIGSIDQSTGRYFGTDNESSTFSVSEFFPLADGLDPVEIYDDSSRHDSSFQADLINDRGFFRNGSSGTNEIYELSNISSGSPTESSIGLNGYPVAYTTYDGQDALIVLNSGSLDVYYDETSGTPVSVDEDEDGYSSDEDCDDSDAAVNPGATEECDGIDNDCDGDTDDDDSSVSDPSTWYRDADSDGEGDASDTVEACEAPSGYVATGEDCDDTDPFKQEEADCSTSSGRDPNCDLAVGDAMSDEIEVAEDTVICDDAEDINEGSAELISSNGGVYFDGTRIRVAEGYGNYWELLDSDANFDFSASGIQIDAEDYTAPMSLGIMNANMAPPPSEGEEECTAAGSTDTTDESKIVTMGYEGGEYTVTGDHELKVTVSGNAWMGMDAKWSDVAEGQPETITAEKCLDEQNPDDTGDSGDTGPVDTGDTSIDTDTPKDDTDPEDTDERNQDTDVSQPGGCQSCASTPLPEGPMGVVGFAAVAALMRRRRERNNA